MGLWQRMGKVREDMAKILVVDDEKLIVKGIRFSLEQDGMEVDCAYDGEEAIQLAKQNEYDVVLLDVMLPKFDGFEVCQAIREFSEMPVIMLTAKGGDMDKILGLEYGADDYITKPFNILEVKARIKAIMRRNARKSGKGGKQGNRVISAGELKLDQQFEVVIYDISTENVCCDGVRLNQILLNLLSNAIKFTPEKGSIGVSMYEEDSPRGEDYVRIHIRVKDNGIGMTPEFRAKIFDSFSREDNARVRKTEGSGLGMAITKYIVDAMGGTVEVESELGAGSEFHVVLDMEKATVQEVDMVLPNWKMLVVDDDEQLCSSTVDALKDIGISADWVMSGERAIEAVNEHHRRGDDYHIVLLDWKLPGMDGIMTARRLRERLEEHVPILLISAYDWSEIESEAREAGISGFISKPLFKSTLFHGLKQYMDPDSGLVETVRESGLEFENRRILLAEDNELNWEVAEELLKELGLELDWAMNGQICVDMFRKSPEGYYDAILMDLRMPVMNGYEATREIRATERGDCGIPIIAMTADAFSDDIKKCLDCGMDAHTAKPINIQEISHLLKRFMKEK